MNIHRIKKGLTFTILGVVLIFFLAACQPETTPSPTSIPTTQSAQFTVAALETENADLSTQIAELSESTLEPPTATQAATKSPTAGATDTPGPTLSIPEGVTTTTHLEAQGYVFVFDPEVWVVESAETQSEDFLVHKEISNCTINLAPETPPGELLQYYPRILGRQGWLVEGYEEITYYTHKDLKLDLSVSEDEDCILAQVTVLAEVITEDEFDGAPARPPAVQPTQRSTPQGFTCDDALPSRLQVGDRALIIAGTLWLRSEPLIDEETEIRFFQQYTPVEIQVTDGPVCAEDSVFWEVTVTEIFEGGQTYTGWMAESSGEIYFLDIWYLGW
ncbi:MAG: hypothetical protein MUO67_15160 [Anaerolineales bacterium]|jgi:hypothetical protein|nr:hypothetical protein [Anaerolineales bacterium]